MSLSLLLDNAGRKFNRRIALEDDTRTFTYGDFINRVNRLGQSLLASGLIPGETIAILMHNSIEIVEFDSMASRFGFVRTMLNARGSKEDHVYCLNFASAKVLIFEIEMIEHVEEIREQLEHIKLFICVGGKSSWAVNYEELLDKAQARSSNWTPAEPDIHSIYFTSGTTGQPKGVMLTHGNWIHVVSTHLMDINPRINQDDIGLLCAPITHATGSLVMPHLARGASLKILDHFNPERVAEICMTSNITSSFMAPTMIQLLMQHMSTRTQEKLSFHSLLYGGASFPVDRLEKALEIFGPVLGQLYGQWEAPVGFTVLQPQDHINALTKGNSKLLHSCGRAITFADVNIMDDHGDLLSPGQTGEIVTAGGNVMLGYLDNEEATSEIREGKWQRTGDIGEIDENGFVYITDRKKDMIVTGGNNVYPRQIEEIIYQNKEIEEACIIGIPDKLWGETVHLVAVRRSNSRTTENEIINWARDRLPTDHRIRSVEFVESLPKNNYGKILRRRIRDGARQRSKISES
jgi:acyl-CoA synthetase (AMP-forming)/AMP-acid ligase II